MEERKGRRRIRQNFCISGVYSITNLTNGKIYVGSASNVIQRLKMHERCLMKGTHPNKEMQKDYDSGHKFQFDIMEIFNKNSSFSPTICRRDLYELESKYIQKYDCLNSGYNIHKVLCCAYGTPTI